MKKNNLVNKNIISALLIGISASMAFAQPITAYAEGNEGGDAGDNNESNTNTPEPSVTDDAASHAEDSHEAIEEAITTTTQAAETINGEVPMDAQEVGNAASDAATEAVSETKDLYDTEKLEDADADIQEVKEELDAAAAEDKKAEEEAKEVVDTVEYAQEIADLAVANVDDAKDLSDEISLEITNAATYEEATEAYERLKELVETTTQDVEAKKAILEQLTKDYNEAVAALTTADTNFEEHVENASEKAQDAKEILDDLTEEYVAADAAVEEAAQKVEVEKAAADKITEQTTKTNANWDSQAELCKTILTYYYIPQIVEKTEIPPENIKVTRVKGFDTQDFNYYMVEYTDAEGNFKTLYFNYDRADKKKSNNRFSNLGSSKDIILYEKSAEEIGADNYLRYYYADEDFYKLGVLKGKSDQRSIMVNKANAGDFRVYVYYVDGEAKYLVQEEVEQRLIDDTITYDNGNYYIDGHEITEVIQNKNSKVNSGNEANYLDIRNNEDYLSFIENADKNAQQYAQYEEAADAAKDAVSNAKTEVDALNGALDDLKGSRTNRISNIPSDKIINLLADYGISIDEYNSMSLGQAIAFMGNLLKDAEDKLANAQLVLDEINTNFVEMTQKVDDMKPKAEKTPDGQGSSNEGNTTTSDETADYVAIPSVAYESTTEQDAAVFDQQADEIMGVLFENNSSVAGVKRDGSLADEEQAIYAPVISDSLLEVPSDLLDPSTLKDKTLVVIEDEEIAKSATTETREDGQVSWWWLLVIAILGATGEKMYREYKEKEEEKEKIKA